MEEARQEPNSSLLHWRSLESWHPKVTQWMIDLLGSAAVKRLREIEDAHLYDDDPEWINAVANEFAGTLDQLVDSITEHLQALHVRTFHGTRTDDAGTFHREGVRLHNREHLEAKVRRIVETDKALAWLSPLLEQKFAETAHLIDEGRCYVVADARVLIEECGHYLLGGSEFIQGIIGPDEAQRVLRNSAPTVVEVDLPFRNLQFSQVISFAKTLIGEWAKSHRRLRLHSRRLDFTFVLQEAIPPAWIAGHYHPSIVKDPHALRAVVPTVKLDCLACEA